MANDRPRAPNASGSVAGVVQDAYDKPALGTTVVLVPEPRLRGRIDLFQSASTDQSGRYEFKGIPPGEYKVFAWDDVEPGIWHDPEVLRKYEKGGEPVTVRARQKESITLRLADVDTARRDRLGNGCHTPKRISILQSPLP